MADVAEDIMEFMSDDELLAAIKEARQRVLNQDDSQLSELRKENFDRYFGKPDGRERAGGSTYVTRECFEAVEWALAEVLETFTGGDRVVSFSPQNAQDEAQAEQETDVVNHYLLEENPGFMNFYEWCWDALIYPTSYARIWVEEDVDTKTNTYSGITAIQLQLIEANPENEIIAAEEYIDIVDSPQGPMQEACYKIEVRTTKKKIKICWGAIEPNFVGVDSEHTEVSLDKARHVVVSCLKTKSDLLEMGYDPELVDECKPWSEGDDFNNERTNRTYDTNEYSYEDDGLDISTQLYLLEEWYVRVDYDGDGIAELRKVDVCGDVMLENDEAEFIDVIGMASIPIPHKHDGLAFVESVKPVQELSTFYQRAINENIDDIRDPRLLVGAAANMDDGLTIDQLLDPESKVIECRDPTAIIPLQHQPVIQELLAAYQEAKSGLQGRTGIAPSLAFDPALLKQTGEDAYMSAMASSSKPVAKIKRIFAETGVRELMIKAHRLIKQHQDKSKTVKIRGEWVDTNPQDWEDRTSIDVTVGLGYHDKSQQMRSAMQIFGLQSQLLQIGMAGPEQIMNALEDIVEASGRKGVERYFKLPPPPNPQQQQPDPNMVLAQGQLQVMQQDQQRKDFAEQQKQMRENSIADSKKEGEEAKTQKYIADAVKAYFEANATGAKAQAEAMGMEFGQD